MGYSIVAVATDAALIRAGATEMLRSLRATDRSQFAWSRHRHESEAP